MKRALQLAQILQHGMTAHREGRLAEAERSYQAVLEVKRDDFDSLHLLGLVRWQQRRHDEASKLIKQALRVRPDSAEACANLGIVLHSLDRRAEAVAAYDRALAITGATANDAPGAGLPLVTCAGRGFAARMGASLLNAVRLPELITNDLDGYEALALKLATKRPMIESIRRRLVQNRQTCLLFEVARTCRHIEAAYATMWDIHLRGEPAHGFRVEPS